MTRTKTRTKTRKQTGVRPETLEQFAVEVDEQTGGTFADTVRDLYTVRQQLARLDKRRKDIYAEVKVRYARGTSVIQDAGAPSGGYFLKESVTAVRRYRTVEAAAVRKARPDLWEAARTQQPWVHAGAPDAFEVPIVRGVKLPPAGPMLRTLDSTTLMRHYKAPAFEHIGELRDQEKAVVEELRRVSELTGWDGELINFADGWAVGLWRIAFSGNELKRINPDFWERVAVEKVSGGTVRLDIVGLDRAEDFGMVDLDERDGE